MLKYKSAVIEAQMPSDGIVEGYAATFDREPDSYGDVIAKGAFARTLSEWSQKEQPIPLLYGHNTEDPEMNIGKVTDAYEDERGLHVRAEFDADNPKAQYVRKLAKEGRLYQFSFAYSVRDAGAVTEDGMDFYELRDLDLYEVSLVQIPANQHAVVTGIKSGRRNSKADADELRQIRALAAQITQAINGLLADEDEQDEPDGGPDPDANSEEPDGAKGEEPTGTETDEPDQLEQAKAYAQAILNALEAQHE
jgi:HK97 family phage prohead protease